jgi:hypothetical protein
LKCENPRHKQHLKAFLKEYPTADKEGEFAIITVNPEDFAVDLEHPEKNTVKCCQMCSIREDIKHWLHHHFKIWDNHLQLISYQLCILRY